MLRQEVLNDHPVIRTRLDALAPLLTDATMRRLNYQVSGEGQQAAAVARTFLVEHRLLK